MYLDSKLLISIDLFHSTYHADIEKIGYAMFKTLSSIFILAAEAQQFGSSLIILWKIEALRLILPECELILQIAFTL